MSRRPPAFRPRAIDGVSPSCVALPSGPWRTVSEFLAQRLPVVSHEEWLRRMARGEVLDAQGRALTPDTAYQPETRVYYYRTLAHEPAIPFDATVLYQDDYLVVADKPHFLPVTPAGRYVQQTLLVRLKRELGIDTLSPAHRIDRDTAGLVLFTVQPHTRNLYQTLFRDRSVQKEYEAIAPYREDLSLPLCYRSRLVESAPAFMQMREEAGTANAETQVSLIERKEDLARYALRPVTGQKHQLRAHMAALGIPILNDRIYPQLYPDEGENVDYSRPLQLLAKRIQFIDPVRGEERMFESRFTLRFPSAAAP
ncbi:MAG TPA: pseudouridine synthase [Oxalicibacterium sp.]|jgi:tRNA pseudouridine32 synthase/23S rRNA pseudouridine746 synthase|nr:pseudouridine synthase [Oxalicibacterium sp.]